MDGMSALSHASVLYPLSDTEMNDHKLCTVLAFSETIQNSSLHINTIRALTRTSIIWGIGDLYRVGQKY